MLDPCFFDQVQPIVADGFYDGDARFAFLRHGIFHFGRYYGVYLAVDKTFFFQLAQLGGEHLVRDVRNVPLQLTVAHDVILEPP